MSKAKLSDGVGELVTSLICGTTHHVGPQRVIALKPGERPEEALKRHARVKGLFASGMPQKQGKTASC